MKIEKQSLGEFFSETRKEKGISVDEIVRDTNIPKRYLEAIEADNFDVFPGETYSMGFISNYADALEVDKDLVIGMYKRQMKIEQDAPLEQLVGNKKTFTLNNNTLALIGGVVGVLFLIILISIGVRQGQISAEKAERNRPSQFTYSFDDAGSIINQKFRVGDTITVTNNSTNDPRMVVLNLVNLGPNRVLNLKVNNKNFSARSGELLSVDADNNGTNDLGLEIINAKEKDIKLSITLLGYSQEGSNNISTDNIYNQVKEFILSESEIFVTNVRGDVNVKVAGLGAGYISYTPDNKETKDVYLNNGSLFNILFNHHLILYFGNSGAAKLTVGTKEDTGGGWGEVSKSIYYWKEKGGQFALIRAVLK
jgi:cytoskeleton protein RodZ